MLPRRHRLTRPADFTDVMRGRHGARKRKVGTDLLVVHALLSDTQTPPRVGFVVSKAVGNSVVRHRVVRRLRHQIAERLTVLPGGTDLVVRALPSAAAASSRELGDVLDHAVQRLNPQVAHA